ncbi:MAG: hypothetical protein ABJA10_08450 [Aestuariivirga sp.]
MTSRKTDMIMVDLYALKSTVEAYKRIHPVQGSRFAGYDQAMNDITLILINLSAGMRYDKFGDWDYPKVKQPLS